MTEDEMINLKILCNSFASEYVKSAKMEIEGLIRSEDGTAVFDNNSAEKLIGKFLALAYSKGYADCYDKVKPKRNIVM